MKEILISILSSDAFLGLLASLATAAFTAATGSKWWREHVRLGNEETQAAVQAVLAAALTETWDTYVREIKIARADGKLTKDERHSAMAHACGAARRIAIEQGVPALADMAEVMLRARLENSLRQIRREQYDADPGALRRWLTTCAATKPQPTKET